MLNDFEYLNARKCITPQYVSPFAKPPSSSSCGHPDTYIPYIKAEKSKG